MSVSPKKGCEYRRETDAFVKATPDETSEWNSEKLDNAHNKSKGFGAQKGLTLQFDQTMIPRVQSDLLTDRIKQSKAVFIQII